MVFPRNCYISRESIRLGIKICNCKCNFQELNSPKQKKLHVIILMTRVFSNPTSKTCFIKGCHGSALGAWNALRASFTEKVYLILKRFWDLEILKINWEKLPFVQIHSGNNSK